MKAANFSKALLLLVLLLTAIAVAQKAGLPKYDMATEATLKGVVDEVREIPNSVHLFVTTDTGKVEVQVAPPDFLKDMDVTFAKGDKVEIVAAKMVRDGSILYLARSVTRNNNQLVVRDKKGEPAWTWKKG